MFSSPCAASSVARACSPPHAPPRRWPVARSPPHMPPYPSRFWHGAGVAGRSSPRHHLTTPLPASSWSCCACGRRTTALGELGFSAAGFGQGAPWLASCRPMARVAARGEAAWGRRTWRPGSKRAWSAVAASPEWSVSRIGTTRGGGTDLGVHLAGACRLGA